MTAWTLPLLDSWMAVAQDGNVTVFTGKVELGTGVVTALAQIVAEELDVAFNRVHMDSGDTDKAVDQGVTAASQNHRAGRAATAASLRGGAAGDCSSSLPRAWIRPWTS